MNKSNHVEKLRILHCPSPTRERVGLAKYSVHARPHPLRTTYSRALSLLPPGLHTTRHMYIAGERALHFSPYFSALPRLTLSLISEQRFQPR